MGDRKSERPIVPMRPGNRAHRDPEEGRGRRGMEPMEGKMSRALDLGSVSTRLHRIAELARRAPEMVIVTLVNHIVRGGWVLEADISSFFDTLDHKILRSFLDQRVRDGDLPPRSKSMSLRSRMREICTSGSVGGPGG